MLVRRIEFTEYAILFGEQIRCLDCKTRYAVLSRRLDTSYPTGGYVLSSWIRCMETEGIRRIGNWSNAFSCEVLALIRRISFVRFELIAYSNADHAGCKDDCKSTSGGIQLLGDKLVSWSSKKQGCTVMSIVEAEYVSLSACCAQVIWMRTQLLDYGYKYNRIPMYCDSKSAIAISCNPV
ncbi:hypothetical protein Tco_1021236 [Tanacetum coccineum]